MELYSLIDSLCRPSKPANKTLQEIFKILDGHYKKTTNKRAERVKFNRLVQKPDESIREFVGRLREAARTCAFGDVVPDDDRNSGKLKALILEEALLDRLVMGVYNKAVQVALLQKEHPQIIYQPNSTGNGSKLYTENTNAESDLNE